MTKHDVKARLENCRKAGHQHAHKGMTSRPHRKCRQLQVHRSLGIVLEKGIARLALAEKPRNAETRSAFTQCSAQLTTWATWLIGGRLEHDLNLPECVPIPWGVESRLRSDQVTLQGVPLRPKVGSESDGAPGAPASGKCWTGLSPGWILVVSLLVRLSSAPRFRQDIRLWLGMSFWGRALPRGRPVLLRCPTI